MNVNATRSPAPTALHARTAELCATNAWVLCSGFTIPAVYSSEREELDAIVSRVGLSDLSARHCWRFEGPDAAAFLSFLTTSDLTKIEPGQTARSLWCDDAGFVRGEGLVARLGGNLFELTTGVRDFAWVMDAAKGFDAKVSDITGQRAGIGVRGPLAGSLLAASGFVASPEKSMAAPSQEAPSPSTTSQAWRQSQVSLVRDSTSDGYELWSNADDAIVIWDRLMRVGAVFGVAPVGSVVLETIRVESSLPLAGTDWIPVQFAKTDAERCRPSDLGVMIGGHRRFNGASALAKAKAVKPSRLVQLSSRLRLKQGDISIKGSVSGKVTSSMTSLGSERCVAIGWLKSELATPGAQITVQQEHVTFDVHVNGPCFL
jgi:aminomethyltransferase